jgi:hypothetical protein
MLELDLTGSIEIAAALDFTYGFELTVCFYQSLLDNDKLTVHL